MLRVGKGHVSRIPIADMWSSIRSYCKVEFGASKYLGSYLVYINKPYPFSSV